MPRQGRRAGVRHTTGHEDWRGAGRSAWPSLRAVAGGRAGGGAARLREPVDPGRGRAGRVSRLRGLVGRYLAAHRDFRRPGGADVDPAGAGGPGGHAGSAVLGAVRARPGHGGLRAGVLGLGGPARPADRGDARVRHRGPRAAGRPAGHGRAGRRPGGRGPGCPGVAAVRLARAGGPAAGSGVPGRARPADAPARRGDRRRGAAQLGHARAHRGQPGADRCGRRPGWPRPGRGPG